jgi:hypothetical protein
VWNLANDAGNLGAMTVTSQRVVWRATLTENFNVSIPYIIIVRRGRRARRRRSHLSYDVLNAAPPLPPFPRPR